MEALALKRLLTAVEDLDFWRPLCDLALEVLDEGDEGDSRSGGRSLDGVALEVVAGLRDGGMRLFHAGAKFAAEANKDVALPGVIFGVDLALHLLVMDNRDTKGLVRFRIVESRACLANLEQELLPRRKRLAELAVNVVGLKIPQRLKLQPFPDIGTNFSQLLLHDCERSLKSALSEFGKLQALFRVVRIVVKT